MTDFTLSNPRPQTAPFKRAIGFAKAHQNKLFFAGAALGWAYLVSLMVQGRPAYSFRIDLTPLLQSELPVQLHFLSAVLAFAIGAALLMGVKGRTKHKVLGYIWVAAMSVTAVSSFFLYGGVLEHHSWIHGLSAWVIITLPMGIAAARARKIKVHAKRMTGMFVGGMAIAGLFTFLPGRLMWSLFFGA